MTEHEKMLTGEVYNSRDPELLARAFLARQLVAKLHAVSWDDVQGKRAVLEQLLGFSGTNVWIETPFFCDYGENIFIGDKSFINANCVFLDCTRITIGKNVLIAPAVQLYAVGHPLTVAERITPNWQGDDDPRPPYWDCANPITIGDDCWIGGGTIVTPGITIGAGTTIGAGSVVTKDIPAGVLAFGNPCRVVRKLL